VLPSVYISSEKTGVTRGGVGKGNVIALVGPFLWTGKGNGIDPIVKKGKRTFIP